MPLDLGDILPWQFAVRDTTGALVNATGAALTVTDPTGATTTPALANPSTGIYQPTTDPATTIAGLWQGRFVATSPVVATVQTFYVEDNASPPVVSLTEAKQWLRITTNVTADDELLRYCIDVATDMAESYTNVAWRRTTITQTLDGRYDPSITLELAPVLSVTSLVESGTSLTGSEYTIDASSGIIWRGGSNVLMPWRWGHQNIVVTYVTGPAGGIVPSRIRHGVLEMVRHLWASQRGGGNLPRQAEDFGLNIQAFAYPNRVRELWDGDVAVGLGFA